jgi:hypothetical protein
MRTKAHRYGASVPSATFTNGTEIIGVTGDFEGGFVQANAYVFGVPGVGGYVGARFLVDGVTQGPLTSVYQSAAGGTAVVVHAMSLRIPQGRHRVSVLFNTNAAPLASSSAELSVAELNA